MRTLVQPLIASGTLLLALTAAPGSGFESAPDRHPAELLPAEMVSGPDFRVVDPVHGDGLMNHFVLDSRFGKFDAYGRAALAARIREVAALTELSKTSDIQIAAGGVVHGVESEVKTATGVVTHPVKTVTGIPQGIAHLFAGYKARGEEAVADANSDLKSLRDQSSSGGDSSSGAASPASAGDTARKVANKGAKAARSYAERYLGITAAERDYYKKLGVDPYTDNEVLRDTIRRDAKISAAAGFGVKFVSLPAIPGIGITQRVVDSIYNEDPAAIRERTRGTLAGYGLSAAEIESFMNAPLLSPTRQVVLLSAAEGLQGVAQRAELFRHSLGLKSNEEAQVYLRSVGLLVKAHSSHAVASVVPGVRLPAALRADGSVVVCGAFESVYWTGDVAQYEESLRNALASQAPGGARELWVAGTISDGARAALRDRGWQLYEVSDDAAVPAGLAAVAGGSGALSPLPPAAAPPGCPDAGLRLPAGFCATVFADNLGHTRHLAVAPNGVVYVNTWSGRRYHGPLHEGGFLVVLQDTTGNGRANVIERFGPAAGQGGHGGTGIALYQGAVYAEESDRIERYALPAGSIVPRGPPDVIVSGLPLGGDHPMHPFAIDADGMLYVDVASATNACQERNRQPRSAGLSPCTELETRGGIWRYDANRTNQRFSPAERYASGIRNADGIAVAASGHGIYATQHGRDQLHNNWPALYGPEEEATQPAEELLHVRQGGDYGWPTCYFDEIQGKLVLAPEYGGDGGKAVGPCAAKLAPTASFPAHWAPNDLTIYSGSSFPARYQGGAFIAFHGSWDRAPYPQGGYNIVFQPLGAGDAADRSQCEVFADGFAGPVKEPERALHRPSGVAVAPDGALFVSDDVRGTIFRISYRGDAGATAGSITRCPPVDAPAGAIGTANEQPPEGVHPNAGAAASLPVPPGSTRAALTQTIREGVPLPKQYRSPMPPMGGAQLAPEQISAAAAYLWALRQGSAH